MGNYFVCTYGDFHEKKTILERSLKENVYLLHECARYPSALNEISQGDTLLLKDGIFIVAEGKASAPVQTCDDEWKYKITVDQWRVIKPVHAYGIQWHTLLGGQMAVVKKVDQSWVLEKLNEYADISAKKDREFILSIADIASWYHSDIKSDELVHASIPIFQRGLVWRSQQNELLWDSLMRGIPIGSLLLSPTMEEQRREQDYLSTHHILDGQQRCNAISLGFAENSGDGKANVLWLDVDPDKNELNKTSRRYLVRFTSFAHPWGYQISDETGKAACLSAAEIRDAQEELKKRVVVMYPVKANLPIPLGMLTRAFMESGENVKDFWKKVVSRYKIAFSAKSEEWSASKDALEKLSEEKKEYVFRGLQYAFKTRIVAVNAPGEIITEEAEETENSSTLEHLFQRINRQGTRLDGEDLIYSTIKSYWPGIAGVVDECAKTRMPESRMLLIAIRAFLAQKSGTCEEWLSVGRIRRMIAKEDQRVEIQQFLKDHLALDCCKIDEWLSGIPRVLYTTIANHAPEIYVLLLILASEKRNNNAILENDFILALSLYLYFFDYRVRKSRRPALVTKILRDGHENNFTQEKIVRVLTDTHNFDENNPLLIPMSLENEETFRRFFGNRDLLLLAQGDYLQRTFPDYNPAQKELFQEYNRPWDFDHIVAQETVKRWNDETASKWLWCIGNLAAIPFEENRSRGDASNWGYYDTCANAGYQIMNVDQLKTADHTTFPQVVEFRFKEIYKMLCEKIKPLNVEDGGQN